MSHLRLWPQHQWVRSWVSPVVPRRHETLTNQRSERRSRWFPGEEASHHHSCSCQPTNQRRVFRHVIINWPIRAEYSVSGSPEIWEECSDTQGMGLIIEILIGLEYWGKNSICRCHYFTEHMILNLYRKEEKNIKIYIFDIFFIQILWKKFIKS